MVGLRPTVSHVARKPHYTMGQTTYRVLGNICQPLSPFIRPTNQTAIRSFRTNRFPQGSNRNPKFLELTCWTYNSRGFCWEPWCKSQHRCGYCKGIPRASRCRPKITTSQQRNTSNSNTRLQSANTVSSASGRTGISQSFHNQSRHT